MRAADVLVKASDDELSKAGLDKLVHAEVSYMYSGLLPIADRFYEYTPEDRERICRWNDAWTIDESKRQDRLVDNEIRQSRVGTILTFVLMVFFGVLTLCSFLITGNVASFGFLAVPVLNVLGNMMKPVFSRSSRSSQTGDTDINK